MNTYETYVSLETAKLLKQAGFDWPCNHAICCDSTHYPNLKEGDVLEYNHLECSELMEGKKPHMLLCPTLDVAQRWLREVKNYHICISFLFANNHKYYAFVSRPSDRGHLECECGWIENKFDTYEEAQEAGIKKALEIILEKEK